MTDSNLQVLFEDNHILVVQKPAMVPVQADESGDLDLLQMAKNYIAERYHKPGKVYLGLVHRLDRPVGGVMVIARTSKAAQRLQGSMQQGLWQKRYLAVVEGKAEANAELIDFLWKDEKTRCSYAVDASKKGAKRAQLSYTCLDYQQELSLLDVALETGRHHQIRVQLASRNLPIWGDARYNPNSKAGQAIALFAYTLSFPHPTLREQMTFSALPAVTGPWQMFKGTLQEKCALSDINAATIE